jgi:hypothetical protein
MKNPIKFYLILLNIIFLNSQTSAQSKTITVNKLVDIEIGMTYEKVIEKYSNHTLEEKKGNKIDIYYKRLELSNGTALTDLLLSFYKNKLYDISTDYSNTLHLGLINKYGYKSIKGMTFNGYYGTTYKSNISAVYIDNRIWIIDNNIRKIATSEGF